MAQFIEVIDVDKNGDFGKTLINLDNVLKIEFISKEVSNIYFIDGRRISARVCFNDLSDPNNSPLNIIKK